MVQGQPSESKQLNLLPADEQSEPLRSDMTKIPFLDLKAQVQSIRTEADEAIARVLDSGQFILGVQGETLEREVAAFCGTKYAVAVASGTDALSLSLRASGIGRGDKVITSAFSFIATAEAIFSVGAIPVFVDIEPESFNLDPKGVEASVDASTQAILPVHLFGASAAMEPLMQIAEKHKLIVIEDCAQAIGAAIGGKRVGSFGHAGCLSFYPTKNLSAFGDAGMVVTNDAKILKKLRLIRQHGDSGGYQHQVLGTNSRLDEIQAAVLRVKLPKLDGWIQARRKRADIYREALKGIPEIQLPVENSGTTHVYHAFTVRVPKRDAVRKHLNEAGIGTQVYYPAILPSQPALRGLASGGSFPEATLAAASVLSLPLYPELSDGNTQRVAQVLREAVKAL